MAQSIPAKLETAQLIAHDPATGEEIGSAPLTMPEDVARAVGRAREAQSAWARASFRERARVIMKARRIVLKELEEIALLVTRETGKPVSEAIAMELVPTLDLMHHFARHTASLLRRERIAVGLYAWMGRSSYTVCKPLGVVGIISPWNFPWATPLDEVVMALMAGNVVVLKPSELTPLTSLKIKEVFDRAGIGEGALQVVTGDGSTGAALVASGVDKIMFTGSVATGRRVAEAAAKYLTPVVLELGGKDPMIVLEDADLESASRAAVWGAFSNSGQACASVERCYVQENVASRFIELVLSHTKELRQTAGSSPDADIASMSSERQLQLVENQVDDAVERGATVLVGGRRTPGFTGPFYEPTLITGVDHSMPIMCEETFGPVLPFMTFATEDEAVQLANDSVFGLTASVWTKDIAHGKTIASRLEAGTVMINEVLYTHGIAQTPWGGVKQSGLGRTHGKLGLLELVSPRHIHINRLGIIPDIWWFGYTPIAAKLFRGLARRFATGSLLQTSLLTPQILKRLFERKR